MLASSAVDRGLEPLSGQTKEYKIGIGCFSTNLTASGQLLNRHLTTLLSSNQIYTLMYSLHIHGIIGLLVRNRFDLLLFKAFLHYII
jgi:hypothetical protein